MGNWEKKINAKSEFLNTVSSFKVITSLITCKGTEYILKTEYTDKEYLDFLNSLDFKYDNGYGGKELYGTIWGENGIWCSRGEYDGSEWWETNKYPQIHDKCRNLDREREKEINKVLGE